MIQNCFPTQIGVYDISYEELELVINEINLKQNTIETNLESDVWCDNLFSTSQKVRNILFEHSFYKTLNIIEKYAKEFFCELNESMFNLCVQDKVNNPYLADSWFNYLKTYGYQNTHTHVHMNVMPYCSGVFFYDNNYVVDNEDLSTIVFEFDNNITFYNQLKNLELQYTPGRILFFPPNLPHRVKYNKSPKIRKSISFNFFNIS